MGPRCYWWDISTFMKVAPLYPHYYILLHVMHKSSSPQGSEWSGSDQLPQEKYHY